MKLTLFRKDVRLFRIPLVAGVVLAALPYLVHVPFHVHEWHRQRADADRVAAMLMKRPDGTPMTAGVIRRNAGRHFIQMAVLPAALQGLGLVSLLAAAYGGVAFAAERRNRSAEFMAMLPVSRSRLAASKLLAAAACLLLPALVHAAALAFAWHELALSYETRGYADRFYIGAANCAAMTLMTFGVAWLLSSVFESPAVAGLVAVGVAAFGVYLIAHLGWLSESADGMKTVSWEPAEYVTGVLWRPGVFYSSPQFVHDAVRLVAAVAGVAALLVGTAVYARRVRP